MRLRVGALVSLLAVAACGNDPPPSKASAAIAAGRAAWAARKPTCRAYNYDRSDTVNGPNPITGVQIENDTPVWRSFIDVNHLLDAGVSAEAWVESGAEIGSHARGYPAYTVEQLYDDCAIVVDKSGVYDVQVVVMEGVPMRCGWENGACIPAVCPNVSKLLGFSCGSIEPPQFGSGGAEAGVD